jgi:hypothetical protein
MLLWKRMKYTIPPEVARNTIFMTVLYLQVHPGASGGRGWAGRAGTARQQVSQRHKIGEQVQVSRHKD